MSEPTLQDMTNKKRRGRPTYGDRKVITIRVPAEDLSLINRTATEKGHPTTTSWLVDLIYEQLGRETPPWAAPE